MATPSVPTGIITEVYRNEVYLTWVQNPELDIQGYNVYNSTTSGGGVSGYVKLNQSLIDEFTSEKENILSTEQQVVESGGIRTTTTVQNVSKVKIYSYTHSNLTTSSIQYYVITAVNKAGEESPNSIEVPATPLIVPLDVTTQPIRTFNDVSLDYITTLLDRQPNLDVKPSSVTRQLHIDPNSQEFAYAYTRIDFLNRSQSILTLRQLDDSDNDRISDPVSSSPYKQALKQAYFLTNDSDVQTMIDTSFDMIGSNYGMSRKQSTNSVGSITFYTNITPTKDIVVNVNTSVSTLASEAIPSIRFYTLNSGTIEVANLNKYYNAITQRWELTLSIVSESTGSNTNVSTGTIVVSTASGLNCTNEAPTYNGRDLESNADFADRIQLAFLGLDVGTANGYKRVVTSISGVTDQKIVGAGDQYMQRDYDDVRKKHVYGKVDIYVNGGVQTQFSDVLGFLYKYDVDQTMSIIDVTDMVVKTQNANVTTAKPIFEVQHVRCARSSQNYDILGNCTVKLNGQPMTKGETVSVDLVNGVLTFIQILNIHDIITADYDYKVQVTGETVIATALGGEVNFSLDNSPVIKQTYTIYKNGTALIEGTNYTLNLLNGYLQLTSGLIPGDTLTADYKYKKTITGEVVISDATGVETTANLLNQNLLESIYLDQDGMTIDLEQTNLINASIGMFITDTIYASYRYRDSDSYVLLKQPVTEIISITGTISGTLDPATNYSFNKIDDILLEGNSSKAQRYVSFTYANGKPSGSLYNGLETIVMLNNDYTELLQKGIDENTLVLKKGATTYVKGLDYYIRHEANGVKVSVGRTKDSNIPNGVQISATYEYGELLTITYNCNPLIQQVQNEIQQVQNITADVLVKGVLETLVDYEIGVVLKNGSDEVATSLDIRNAIFNEHANRKLGETMAQSDIIRAIETVTNVVSVVSPSTSYGMMTKMVKADGTQVNREVINKQFVFLSSTVVSSYKAANALLNSTLGSTATDGFYAVFEDDRPLTLVASANLVDSAAGQAFISSNRDVIVSMIEGGSPNSHKISVSYVVSGESGSKDINISSLEYTMPGEVLITTTIQ